MTQTLHVHLGARSYDVHIDFGLIARAGALIGPFATSKRVFIVTDEHIAPLHLSALLGGLHGLSAQVVTLPPGEGTKSFAGLEQLTRALLQAGISRRDLVIALGGGVVGDVTGLAAGLVMRGVDFVQIPTTLLAQVDSSVGGKTAIDTPEGKNLVGLIHQPRLVLVDLDVLATLPDRELRCGYAEIVKIGLINDLAFFEWCETKVRAILAREPQALARAVHTAIAAKAAIVEADEREAGPRALLNLGHTFAHALETVAGYDGALLHGEAVGVGMALAFAHSAQLGLCRAEDAARVRAHLGHAGLITNLGDLPGAPHDPAQLMSLMAGDKKAEAGAITLILARSIGEAFIQKNADAEALAAFLKEETK